MIREDAADCPRWAAPGYPRPRNVRDRGVPPPLLTAASAVRSSRTAAPGRRPPLRVATREVDVLVARPDDDAGALTGYGISRGGYWLPRALAFEHRFVAATADGGVVDVSRTWLEHLPDELVHMLDTGQKDAFDQVMATVDSTPDVARTFAFRARPYGITDPHDLSTAVRQYDLRDVAADIRTPLLIADPVGEHFSPGQPPSSPTCSPPRTSWPTSPLPTAPAPTAGRWPSGCSPPRCSPGSPPGCSEPGTEPPPSSAGRGRGPAEPQ